MGLVPSVSTLRLPGVPAKEGELMVSVEEVQVCPECDEPYEEGDEELRYECNSCGNVFGKSDGLGQGNTCPDCNKWAARSGETHEGCTGDVSEAGTKWKCGQCEELHDDEKAADKCCEDDLKEIAEDETRGVVRIKLTPGLFYEVVEAKYKRRPAYVEVGHRGQIGASWKGGPRRYLGMNYHSLSSPYGNKQFSWPTSMGHMMLDPKSLTKDGDLIRGIQISLNDAGAIVESSIVLRPIGGVETYSIDYVYDVLVPWMKEQEKEASK